MDELVNTPAYRSTMERLEALRHTSANGSEYWLAREVHPILGYQVWDKFEPVLERARDAFRGNGIDPSHHIAQTSKMLELGSGAMRRTDDFFLSRAACSFIVVNGDSTKPEIAAGQAYFVVQTRRKELDDQEKADAERVYLREKVAKSHKSVSKAAQDAGVVSAMQGVFHDARYQGLYGMNLQMVRTRKGLKKGEQLYDRAGAMELSMHDFQMNLAAEAIRNEGIRGQQAAINKNKQVAIEVRNLVKREGKTLPENLPLAPEPIRDVAKRLKQQAKKVAKSSPTA